MWMGSRKISQLSKKSKPPSVVANREAREELQNGVPLKESRCCFPSNPCSRLPLVLGMPRQAGEIFRFVKREQARHSAHHTLPEAPAHPQGGRGVAGARPCRSSRSSLA